MNSWGNLLPYRLPNVSGKRLVDPHVVIIGAGASIAACPKDKHGRPLPSLRGISNLPEIASILSKHDFPNDELEDFELLFSNIYGKTEYADLVQALELEIYNYFRKIELPDCITYYDYLVLSLTEKDAIISFNWDPYLIQAYRRNMITGNLPRLIFPHGNVGVGVCYDCNQVSFVDLPCPVCSKKLAAMPLLFPIGKKDYNSNPLIRDEWKLARDYLSRANGITVFGYSAPISDVEAFDLMKTAYLKSNVREIAPFTIINTPRSKESQMEKWSEFFDRSMMIYCTSFEETILWNNPRVSLESLFDAILQQHPRTTSKPFKKFDKLSDLQEFVKTIDDFDLYI